jgi:GntR family transcriptional regulator/MocR family aminotransferase
VAPAKIQLKGQFVITCDGSRPLSLQIVAQLQEAIETGRLVRGTRLPSTRSLARTLRVSRNTVLTAYEELVSRGLLRSRRGAGMYVSAPVGLSGFNLKAIMREAQYPSRTIALRDQDGNPLCITY